MSDAKRTDQHQPGLYEIRLQGHLAPRWAARFDVPTLAHEPDGSTLIRRIVADQAALHGLLQMVRDLGLPLISVRRIDTEPSS